MGKTCKVRHHVLNNQTVDAILTGRANVTTCQVQDIITNCASATDAPYRS